MKTVLVNLEIEFNTNGQPTGNAFINGSKHTYTASQFTEGCQLPGGGSGFPASFLVAYQAYRNGQDNTSLDIVLKNTGANPNFITVSSFALAAGQGYAP